MSHLGKHNKDIHSNHLLNDYYPLLKKQKFSHSFPKHIFSSMICLSCYSDCSISISNDNEVYSFGSCNYGIHGHEERYIDFPKQIKNLSNIKMIDCGYFHTICLDYNGNVYSFGSNNEGMLGIGKDYRILKFTHIPQKLDLPFIIQISCCINSTIALSDNGLLFAFGSNSNGQLVSDKNYLNTPQVIPDLINIEFVMCGAFHVICKSYDNKLYCWGYNGNGQLGNGNYDNCEKPTECTDWPDNIIDIKCGNFYSLLLTSKGQVYSFGDNTYGQLGINDKDIESINIPTLIKDIPEIQKIECGKDHSMCIDINNNLWLFGENEYGQLGLGDTKNRYKPILHPTLSEIIDISSGGIHTFVKTFDNKIYAFGKNNGSQLGIKTSEDNQLTPIQVLEGKEDIWSKRVPKIKQKSARK